MKRALASILAVLYLSTSLGATLHLHYCMGKLVAMDLAGNKGGSCAFCGMPRKAATKDGVRQDNGCCKDEQKQVKSSGDQTLVQPQGQSPKLFPVAVEGSYASLPVAFLQDALSVHPPANGPPPAVDLPVFLLIRSIRL